MSEEKTVLYTRKHPVSDGGFDDQAQAMVKAAAEAGYEAAPRGSYCEGDMRKQFEALTGVKLDDDVSWEIVVVQKDRSLSEWGARPNKAAPLLYLSSAVSLSSRCGAGDWMACRPWSPTGWWP